MRRKKGVVQSDDEIVEDSPPAKRNRGLQTDTGLVSISTGNESGRKRTRDLSSASQAPPGKVFTFCRGEDGFCPGNIMEVRLTNFMTYDFIQAQPSARLNLIIGPNGTGKSSLVCALGIGLAGEPKHLGRAGNIGDFVQRGKDWSVIEITLRGGNAGDRHQITRRFNNASKSEWQLDGKTVRKEDVRALTKKFNIQVGNLTQFLPQDRVCEFAKLSPVELLMETEKAVGDSCIHEQHLKLMDLTDDLRKIETTLKSHEKTLSNYCQENAELEKDVNRVRQRRDMLAEADTMKLKLPWLMYEKKKVQFLNSKELYKRAKAQHAKIKKEQVDHQAPLRQLQKEKDNLKERKQACEQQRLSDDKLRYAVGREDERLDGQMREATRQLEQLRASSLEQEAKYARVCKDHEEALAALSVLPASEEPPEVLNTLGSKILDLRQSAFRKGQERKEVDSQLMEHRRSIEKIDERLKNLASGKHRRMEALKDRNVIAAFTYVEVHHGQFQGQVFGPLAIEISSPDMKHAKAALEQHVPKWLWTAFVTTDAADRDMLMSDPAFKNLKVAVINVDAESGTIPSTVITDEMRALGITHTLDDVFDAHPIVKKVLCAQTGLQRSFLGSSEAEQHMEVIPTLDILDLWTPNNHYRWQRSRYHSNYMSTNIYATRPCQWLGEALGNTEVQEQQQVRLQVFHKVKELEAKAAAIHLERAEIEEEVNLLLIQRDKIQKDYDDSRKRRALLERRVESCASLLSKLKIAADIGSKEKQFVDTIHKLNEQRFSNILKSQKLLLALGRAYMELPLLKFAEYEADAMLRELELQSQVHVEALQNAAREEKEAAEDASTKRDELAVALQDAMKAVNIENNPHVKEKFKEYPGTLEALQEAIDEKIAEANAILCPSLNVVAEYEQREHQIRDLEEELGNERDELQRISDRIESTKEQWLPGLRDLISKISSYFSKNFAEMAVAGEVCLDEKGTDFGAYGIHIKVKFRENTPLQVLSASHQSGGERSVSTILYLVSLQNLTQCPFRVVDEINQGMDPNNERKMFQQLVRAASQPNTAQCFLLTPKLLPDLDYGEYCSILSIMNGPWIGPAAHGAFKKGCMLTEALRDVATSA